MSLVVIQEGTRRFTRDGKRQRWEISSPTATTPEWSARSYGYTREGFVTVLGGATLEGLLHAIEVYSKEHPFKLHADDAETAILAGGFGALVGGAIAAGAALLGARTVARIALLKTLGGVGLLGGGLYLSRVIDREKNA
jgi:hypothetical protein